MMRLPREHLACRVPRRTASVAAVMVLSLAAAGCGAGAQPHPYQSTGVDGLVIPTPSLDPDDFVDRIDNQWLPLKAGASWTYEVSEAGRTTGQITIEVEDETRDVGGVDATVVSEVVTDERGVVESERREFFSQDEQGNVWLVAVEVDRVEGKPTTTGSWVAGLDGAQAGLAMPAEPRVGDGFRRSAVEGIDEAQMKVVEDDLVRAVGTTTYDDVVEMALTAGAPASRSVTQSFAPGVGLVLEQDETGGEVELIDFTAG